MSRLPDPLPNWIGGDWTSAGDVRPIDNPSDLDTPVGNYVQADRDAARQAVQAARAAAPAWQALPPKARGEILSAAGRELAARADEIGLTLSAEEGKTLPEGIAEVRRAGEIFQYYGAKLLGPEGELLRGFREGVDIQVRRRPRGVVALITPWNFPAAIPAWKMAPALAYGNTVVLKPAELVPATSWAIVEILSRQGLPPGAVNLVMGRGSIIGDALVNDPDVDAISFTGSTGVGRGIAAAAAVNLTPVQLELGGKNALVVLDDADLDQAVEAAVNGAYYSTGQRCTASSRLIVTPGIRQKFTAAVLERLQELVTGHALDPQSNIGPVVDERQLATNLEYIGIGKEEGAELAVEGQLLKKATRGHFLSPTLFTDTDNGMRINRQEIFGPVATIIPAASYDEALELVNDSAYGLVAGIMTDSLSRAVHFREHARVGMTMVNLPTAGMDFHAPFGGTKASGFGPREQGDYARDFYTEVVTAYVKG